MREGITTPSTHIPERPRTAFQKMVTVGVGEMMNEERKPMSRWKWLGLFLFAYLVANIGVLILYSIMSDHWDAGQFWLTSFFFPVGIFVLFRVQGDAEWIIPCGYAVYALLAAAGIFFRSKAILCGFCILLLLNLGGCYMAVKDWEEGAWGATDSPTTRSTRICQPAPSSRLAKTVT